MHKEIDSGNTHVRDNPTSVRRLLGDFCGYTTAHGLGRLSESKNIFSRLTWSLFCIGASTMFVLQVYNLLLIYLSRPVSTVVKVEHERRAQFPAVTICNMNMLRAGELPYSYIENILEAFTPYVNESHWDEQTNNTSANSSFSNDDSVSSESSGGGHIIDYEESVYFGSSAEETKGLEYQIEEAILAKVARENDSTLFAMGHQFKDFVFECSYRGYDCSNYTRYWHTFWDFRFGNCFTFNSGLNDFGQSQKVLHSFNTGPAGGLKLQLFIEQSQYIPELSHAAGARVVIHDQGQMPFPDNEGNDVLPSRSTSFAIRKSVIERVDPFGNGSCISGGDFKDNIYANKFNATYSRQACLNSCLAKKQTRDCGCAEAQFPAETDVCDIQNSTTAKCLDILLRDLLSGELKCEVNCPTPCTEVIFRTSLSMSHWPSFGYEEILEQKVQGREVYTSEGHFGYYLSENFLEVKIFFEQLNFERVVERVSYKGVNLVADIGGQLGLWIGISVLTCCELLELILLIIQSAFKKMFSVNIIHVKPA